jgi:hypothetical protein
MPLLMRTRATFRRAEFGFLGVTVFTTRHTPRLNGEDWRAGDREWPPFVCRG